jgi:hypothetical protein
MKWQTFWILASSLLSNAVFVSSQSENPITMDLFFLEEVQEQGRHTGTTHSTVLSTDDGKSGTGCSKGRRCGKGMGSKSMSGRGHHRNGKGRMNRKGGKGRMNRKGGKGKGGKGSMNGKDGKGKAQLDVK